MKMKGKKGRKKKKQLTKRKTKERSETDTKEEEVESAGPARPIEKDNMTTTHKYRTLRASILTAILATCPLPEDGYKPCALLYSLSTRGAFFRKVVGSHVSNWGP